MMPVELNLLAAACFLILAGFFSGMETGIYVLDPLRYHVRVKQGDTEARLLERLLRKKSQLVTSLLVGTNISIFLVTIYATRVTEYFYPGAGFTATALMTTVFTTIVVLIFAEMLPKNIYRNRANTLVYSSARAFYISNRLFLPAVKALSLLTGAVNYLFGQRGTLENEFLTRKAVEHHMMEEGGKTALSKSQLEMVRNIMQLPVKNLMTAMIPLREVVMVNEAVTYDEVLRLAEKWRYSRMPVYGKSRTDISGVLNIFDLFYDSSRQNDGSSGEGLDLTPFVRPIPSISRSTRIDEALVILREARQPMGLVVGPSKEAIGIVTVKDLLDEITGEIGAW